MAINSSPASVTIQEVADLAKVSPKTVSRVINNEPRVRSDTRARILDAIEQLSTSNLNYVDDPIFSRGRCVYIRLPDLQWEIINVVEI